MTKKLLFIFLSLFLLTTPALATNISNADIDDEDMADITDWTDNDTGDSASTQVTFDSKSTMKHDGGSAGNNTLRYKDVGVFGTRTVVSFNLYFDAIGLAPNDDEFDIGIFDNVHGLFAYFGTNGLFIYNNTSGATYAEVGTDLVAQDTWQEWTFDINWTAVTVDVYLNQVLQASGVDFHYNTSAYANGLIRLLQLSTTTANRISYVDWEKAGSDFAAGARRIILIE